MSLAVILGMVAFLASGRVPVPVWTAEQPPQAQTEERPPESKPAPEPTAAPPQTSSPGPVTETKPDQSAPKADPAAPPTSSPSAAVANKKPAAKKPATLSAKKKKRRRKTTAKAAAPPSKVVVRQGGVADPTVQLEPTVNGQQASSQLENTNHLLDATGANLYKISGRELSSSQHEMVSQIRKYMEQAKAAATAGDVQRANNLAVKAQLLSEELVKQ